MVIEKVSSTTNTFFFQISHNVNETISWWNTHTHTNTLGVTGRQGDKERDTHREKDTRRRETWRDRERKGMYWVKLIRMLE